GDLALQLGQVVAEVAHRVRLDRPAGLTQLLPVRQLGHHGGAFGPDRGGGLAEVAAELGVGQRLARRHRERLVAAQVADPAGRGGDAQERRHIIASLAGAALPSRVEARISARWRVRVPALSRDSPPPICIRQELSPAVQTSARVASTERILSASIAVDTSAFLTANVPP